MEVTNNARHAADEIRGRATGNGQERTHRVRTGPTEGCVQCMGIQYGEGPLMGADLRTPYHHAREAGYGDQMKEIKNLLNGDEWYSLPMQCTPRTLAAGAVYYLHKQDDDWPDKTQVEVADAFDTTTMSVRNGWKHLGMYYGLLDPEETELPN